MPDLNTKTLNELDTITEMGENDKVLVESSGRMKKFSGEIGGGGIIVLTEDENQSIGISYNQIMNGLQNGKMPILLKDLTINGHTGTNIYNLYNIVTASNAYGIVFSYYSNDNGGLEVISYVATSENGILTRYTSPQ